MSEHRTETKTPETYCVTFGSTSDENNILPGIIAFTQGHPDVKVRVQYASADNTPRKVHDMLRELTPLTSAHGALITGAGMSNVLTGVCKAQYAGLNDLVVGVPLTDNSSAGLTAFLSTVEKPPYNPVFTVGLNNTNAALEIAYRFMHAAETSREPGATVGIPEQTRRFLPDFCLKLEEVLNEFDILFSYRDQSALESDGGVVINPFGQGICPLLKKFDRAIAGSGGTQIVYSVDPIYADVSFYERIMKEMGGMSCTGMTTSLSPVNAVVVAAQLTRNKHALQLIEEKRQTRVEKLNQHPGLVVVNGEIEN